MRALFSRRSKNKSKSKVASTSAIAAPSPTASSPQLAASSTTVSAASPPSSSSIVQQVSPTPAKSNPSPTFSAASGAPPTPSTALNPLDSASYVALRTLLDELKPGVPPSKSKRIFLQVFEGAADGASKNLDLLSLVPIAAPFAPVVRVMLVVALLNRDGGLIREECRGFAERMAEAFELLAEVTGAKADQLCKKYDEIINGVLELNADRSISKRQGTIGKMRLGLHPSLPEAFSALHAKLDRLHLDFGIHLQLAIYEEVKAGSTSRLASSSNLGPLEPPPPLPSLLGREELLKKVTDALQSGTGVVLSGTGGIGKTTLALGALHSPELDGLFKRRVFVPCETTPSRDTLVGALIRVRGHSVDSGEEPITEMEKALREESTLLLLDNLETPLDADGAKTRDLVERLAAISTVSLLITTRDRNVTDELLPRPLQHFPVPELSPGPAKELFLLIAPAFKQDPDLDQLLQQLDGYPLVIRLVASRAREEDDLASVLQLWRSELDDFDEEGGTKKSSLAISLSISLSSATFTRQPQAQHLLALLAGLPRALSHSRIAALRLGRGEQALMRTSLVKVVRQGSLYTIGLLAPVREYVNQSTNFKLADLPSATKRLFVHSFLDDFERLPKGGAPIVWNLRFPTDSISQHFASNAVEALKLAFAESTPAVAEEKEVRRRAEGALLQLSMRLEFQQRYIGRADEAMGLFKAFEDPPQGSKSPLIRLALLLRHAHLDEAAQDLASFGNLVKQIDELIDEAQLEPSATKKLRTEVQFTLGLLVSRLWLPNPDSVKSAGEHLLQKALESATTENDPELCGWLRYSIATVSPRRGVEFVTRQLREALKIADEHNLLVLAANGRRIQAQWEEDLPRRKVLLQEAREIFDRIPDKKSALDMTWEIVNIN
ncbi:hypothetical protein BCR35DRAFT_334934 [Leucosporidium creatinivorum]|uniref:NB-ARC domain-containing protein n=1 Tax=Leucosporidium creatinivorum TaxID=106004 RepID=A0A1Y2DPX6_9BASI|nr:hypothetical protein BCR35DRAFT_334934 [Leucosporidium creatinivorum]